MSGGNLFERRGLAWGVPWGPFASFGACFCLFVRLGAFWLGGPFAWGALLCLFLLVSACLLYFFLGGGGWGGRKEIPKETCTCS